MKEIFDSGTAVVRVCIACWRLGLTITIVINTAVGSGIRSLGFLTHACDHWTTAIAHQTNSCLLKNRCINVRTLSVIEVKGAWQNSRDIIINSATVKLMKSDASISSAPLKLRPYGAIQMCILLLLYYYQHILPCLQCQERQSSAKKPKNGSSEFLVRLLGESVLSLETRG